MLFSERNGHAASLQALAPDEISIDLRNSLWNEVTEWASNKSIKTLCTTLWKNYYKKPIDQIPYRYHDQMEGYALAWDQVRGKFFKAEWHEVYDFLEFLFHTDQHMDLEKKTGRILKRELAGYGILNKQFIQITSELELSSLAESMQLANKFKPVSSHIESALKHLSNRCNPDYRNSIKESISAVEAIAKIITAQPNATLGEALKTLEIKHNLHGALKSGYLSLYGYTNDSNGIRHALMEESNLTQADAKYFLISCSGFVNYLKTFIVNND